LSLEFAPFTLTETSTLKIVSYSDVTARNEIWELSPDSAHLNNDIAAVPEPATLLLLGTGIFGLAGWARKKFKN